MKIAKSIVAALLIVCALFLVYTSLTARDSLPGLLERMDPQQLAAQDSQMERAKKRVTDAIAEDNPEKILRSLDRYLEGFKDQLTLDSMAQFDLFFFKNGPSMLAVGLFLLLSGLVLLLSALCKNPQVIRLAWSVLIIAAVYAAVYVAENVTGSNSMLMTVLKKGVIYALIAVSMNLLNGFTGLFSLGQAGFMLIGAYVFAIFSIETGSRAQVYQYYDGGLIQFTLPTLVSLVLAGLSAAFFAFLIGLPVLRLKSDYLAIATLGFAEIIRALFQYDGLGPITNGSNLLRKFTTFETALFPFAVVGVCIALIALLAMYQTTVQASAFKASMTYEILLIVVIGGMGSISGSIIASFLFVAASEWWLRFLDNETMIGAFQVPLLRSGFRMVAFSAVIMAVVLLYRKGIMGDRELSLSGLTNRLARKKGGRGHA